MKTDRTFIGWLIAYIAGCFEAKFVFYWLFGIYAKVWVLMLSALCMPVIGTAWFILWILHLALNPFPQPLFHTPTK